jgi:hypothetical protein
MGVTGSAYAALLTRNTRQITLREGADRIGVVQPINAALYRVCQDSWKLLIGLILVAGVLSTVRGSFIRSTMLGTTSLATAAFSLVIAIWTLGALTWIHLGASHLSAIIRRIRATPSRELPQ